MGVGSARVGFFRLVWRILEGIRKTLHLVLLLVIFGFVLAALHTSNPIIPHTAALLIAPEGSLVEQLSSDPVRRAFGEASGGPAPETLLRDVTDAIASAKSDSRIKLIVLDLGSMDRSGLSKQCACSRSSGLSPWYSFQSRPINDAHIFCRCGQSRR